MSVLYNTITVLLANEPKQDMGGGGVQLKTILVNSHPSDWSGDNPEFGREFLVVALLLVLNGHFACYYLKLFTPSPHNSDKYQYGTVSIPLTGLQITAGQRKMSGQK